MSIKIFTCSIFLYFVNCIVYGSDFSIFDKTISLNLPITYTKQAESIFLVGYDLRRHILPIETQRELSASGSFIFNTELLIRLPNHRNPIFHRTIVIKQKINLRDLLTAYQKETSYGQLLNTSFVKIFKRDRIIMLRVATMQGEDFDMIPNDGDIIQVANLGDLF
jgi:hypothetical protein